MSWSQSHRFSGRTWGTARGPLDTGTGTSSTAIGVWHVQASKWGHRVLCRTSNCKITTGKGLSTPPGDWLPWDVGMGGHAHHNLRATAGTITLPTTTVGTSYLTSCWWPSGVNSSYRRNFPGTDVCCRTDRARRASQLCWSSHYWSWGAGSISTCRVSEHDDILQMAAQSCSPTLPGGKESPCPVQGRRVDWPPSHHSWRGTGGNTSWLRW